MEKIKGNMSIIDMLMVMSEGNAGATQILMQMLNNGGFLYILSCDSLDIRGTQLYMLWNDCCGRNYGKFIRTLDMLRSKVFSAEEVEQNLSLIRAIPFIDDSVIVEGIPSYEEKASLFSPEWKEYCRQNRDLFLQKLATITGPQKAKKFE